jgi:hypothetical protein
MFSSHLFFIHKHSTIVFFHIIFCDITYMYKISIDIYNTDGTSIVFVDIILGFGMATNNNDPKNWKVLNTEMNLKQRK